MVRLPHCCVLRLRLQGSVFIAFLTIDGVVVLNVLGFNIVVDAIETPTITEG